MKVFNTGTLPEEFCAEHGKNAISRELSRAAGSKKLNVNMDIIPPGSHSAKFHAHSVQEEFFLIMQGSGALRTAESTRPVTTGDFFAKPAGLDNPHTLFNDGTEPLHILDIATVEEGDVAFYPDEGMYFLRGAGGGTVLDAAAEKTGWNSEPDIED